MPPIRRWTILVLCLAAVASGPSTARSAENGGTEPVAGSAESFVRDGQLDLEAVVEYFEDLYRSESSTSTIKMIVTRPRRTRTVTMKAWTRGKEKTLIVLQSPPREEGTATLKVEDNLWNYFPRIRRTIRIPPSMMLSSWMGSDFTNDDLVRESSYSEDYTYELRGRTEDPDGWKIRFVAKPDVVGLWNSFELIVSPDGRIPLEATYYDRKDRLARTLRWSEVKVFDGRRIPARLTLIPVDKNEDVEGIRYKTELIYLEMDFDADVPEHTFSLSRLERKR